MSQATGNDVYRAASRHRHCPCAYLIGRISEERHLPYIHAQHTPRAPHRWHARPSPYQPSFCFPVSPSSLSPLSSSVRCVRVRLRETRRGARGEGGVQALRRSRSCLVSVRAHPCFSLSCPTRGRHIPTSRWCGAVWRYVGLRAVRVAVRGFEG